MKTSVKIRGFGQDQLKALQKLGRRKHPFALGPIPGKWVLQDLRWETNPDTYPPFTYTAEFIQFLEVKKPKAPRRDKK